MADFESFLAARLSRGRIHFTREDLLRALSASSRTLTASLSRLARKNRIANPRPGFYLILAEDKTVPDPIRWIDALMKHQKTDYRISLLSAAKFHGATREPEALQLIVPKPLTDFAAGTHRIEFLAQAKAFERLNRPEYLAEWTTDTGHAKAAGIELTLLDCTRWFHKAGGISALAGILRELGAKARPARLAALARDCENPAVMRLGYLLERAGHEEQARALDPFTKKAKLELLDPTSKIDPTEMSGRWKIAVNDPPK